MKNFEKSPKSGRQYFVSDQPKPDVVWYFVSENRNDETVKHPYERIINLKDPVEASKVVE